MAVSPGGDLQTGTADDDLVTRRRRARSWYERGAAFHDTDTDLAFILYWIAFNAAYGKDLSKRRTAGKQFEGHFQKLTRLDKKRILKSTLQDELSASVASVLQNRYLYKTYWRYLNAELKPAVWQEDFQNCKTQAELAKKAGDTVTILNLLFERLYTLRNQLLHGGATHKSNRNRDSVEHGAHIMKTLVPIFIQLMLDNPREDWGPVWHPPGLQGEPRIRSADSPSPPP